MSIRDIITVKVSCADLGRSMAFYEKLGLVAVRPTSEADADWFKGLYGVTSGVRAQLLERPDNPAAMRLELLEWRNQGRGAGDITAPGAGMFAVRTDDIAADLEALRQAGGTVVSPPVEVPGGAMTLATVRDPDGYPIQLMQFFRPGRDDRPAS
ncbi:MAG: lactoylglutathione lyase [Phenylobacterium sp.]|jgi:catechol 2,3-dioxygenase-like lactoylglutathione lyase family enzyme|nr:lactoylglutathione lyase [Phenylobacterium sp.]